VNPALETYPGEGFIAIFGSQLEDDFFEHSLEGGSRRILEKCSLNPDSDPVFCWIQLRIHIQAVGFVAVFGSQLKDEFFEHSLQDLKVGAGGFWKNVYWIRVRIKPFCWIELWIHIQAMGFIAIFGSQLGDDFFEHSLEDLKVGAGGFWKNTY
jgi:hypothetical protein